MLVQGLVAQPGPFRDLMAALGTFLDLRQRASWCRAGQRSWSQGQAWGKELQVASWGTEEAVVRSCWTVPETGRISLPMAVAQAVGMSPQGT